MTYKVTVSYKAKGNNPAMEQVVAGVSKVEHTFKTIGGDKVEVLNVYAKNRKWSCWGIGSILSINMTPEFKKNAVLNINMVPSFNMG